MSEFKGTPGPWEFKYSEEYDTDRGSFIGRDGRQVCWFGDGEQYYPTDGTEPSHEDIALIASAPELLEALKWLQMALNSGTAMDIAIGQEKADAAIAKALGGLIAKST